MSDNWNMMSLSPVHSRANVRRPAGAEAARALTCRGDFVGLERGCPMRINGQDAWFDGFTHEPGTAAIWVYAQQPLPEGSPGVLDGSQASPAWHQVDYVRAKVELHGTRCKSCLPVTVKRQVAQDDDARGKQ